MQSRSKYIKSLLYLGNIKEGERVSQSQCLTLQHFDYHLDRMLGERLEALNATAEAIMNLSVKTMPDNQSMAIYRAFGRDVRCRFSVIFNATFDEFGTLANYDSAMVVTGYISELEEKFERESSKFTKARHHNRATLDVKVVMLDMQYTNGYNSIEVKF